MKGQEGKEKSKGFFDNMSDFFSSIIDSIAKIFEPITKFFDGIFGSSVKSKDDAGQHGGEGPVATKKLPPPKSKTYP